MEPFLESYILAFLYKFAGNLSLNKEQVVPFLRTGSTINYFSPFFTMTDKKQLPFWLLTAAVLIVLPLFTLIQDGMFMDAMLYTSVAHNEGTGWGTFWFPQFSKLNLDLPGFNSFHEQPPLAFGIQSLFFRVLGSSMYVERFYVFVCMCVTIWLISVLWKEVFRNDERFRKLGWLPLLLWITIPTVYWGCSNNVNENTMGIFTLSSVVLSFKLLNRASGNIWKWVLSGIFIFLAIMSKGFPGFFPVGIPVLYWLATRKISFGRAFGYSIILLAVPLVLTGVLFLIPESKESLSIYLFKRALQRISEAPTTDNRFASLISLFMDLLPQLGLLLIFFVIAKAKKVTVAGNGYGKLILFFLLAGLSATAPLMLTMVQKAFYLLPGFPFFAIGGAIIMAPYVSRFTESLSTLATGFRIFKGVTIFLLCGGIIFVALQKGKTGRDREVLHDVYTIGKIIPAHDAIGITQRDFYIDWELQCYLMRYFYISVDFKPQAQPLTYFILDRSLQTDVDLSRYRKLDLGLQKYDLYKLEQ